MHEHERWGLTEILLLLFFGFGSGILAYFVGDWLSLYDGPLKFQNFLKLWGMSFAGGIILIVLIGVALESAIDDWQRKRARKRRK